MAPLTPPTHTVALSEREQAANRRSSKPRAQSLLKALMVLYYFPPLGGGGTQRCLKFAKYAAWYDWQPHILTVSNSHHLVTDVSLQSEIPDSVPVTRTRAILPARFFRKATKHHAQGKIERPRHDRLLASLFNFAKSVFYTTFFIPDEFIGWLPFAVRAGQTIIRREGIDLLFSSGPPNTTHIVAHRLKKKSGLPWVADLRDLWDQYPDSYNPFRLDFRRRLDDKIERETLAAADAIVVVSETMREHILRKLPAHCRIPVSVITNGFDAADFDGLKPISHPDRFTVTHAGALFAWRRLEPFLQALHVFFKRHPVARGTFQLKLLGIIPESERQAIPDMGLSDNVVILDYLPYRETLAHLMGSDVLLLLTGDVPHAANMLTSKLFDYIGAARPILAIGPAGELHRLIRAENLGVAVEAEDTEGIVRTLERFCLHRTREEFHISPHTAERYQRRILTGALSELFRQIREGRS